MPAIKKSRSPGRHRRLRRLFRQVPTVTCIPTPIRGSVSRFCCGTNEVEDDELLPPPPLKPPPPSGPPPTLMLIELTFPRFRLAFTDCEFTIFFLFGPLFGFFRLSSNTTSLLPRLTVSPHDLGGEQRVTSTKITLICEKHVYYMRH